MKFYKKNNKIDRKELYKEAFKIKAQMENPKFKDKMSILYKKIAEGFDDEYDIKYSKYIGLYTTLQTIYKSCHWLTRGTAYYSDHQLFERLYSEITEEIDFLVEKMIALFGRECADPVTSSKIIYENLSEIIGEFNVYCDPDILVSMALYFELLFLELNDQFYKDMKNSKITLGLDDLIMSNHSKHENNLYLLKSRFSVNTIKKKEKENE